jgi:hypothetical protein
MTRRSVLALALLTLAAPKLALAQSAKRDSGQYRVGDRLEGSKATPSKTTPRYRELKWDELISPSWNPEAIVKSLNLDMMMDGDARAIAAMEQLRQEWNNAPANPALDNTEVRLAGFVVPLERDGTALKEFLLVPYFGACIHVPPPPANQIVHVIASKPVSGTASMDAVWVDGKLTLDAVQTHMGRSAYRLQAAKVEPYKKP